MFENIFFTFWKTFILAFLLIIAFALPFYMLLDVPTPAFDVSFVYTYTISLQCVIYTGTELLKAKKKV